MNRSLTGWIAKQWCAWTHEGGTIERDPLGRINWQCGKCGRWGNPVSLQDEAAMIDRDIKNRAVLPEADRP